MKKMQEEEIKSTTIPIKEKSMIKLPEELKTLTEDDNVIYHFSTSMDLTEFLITLRQLPHWNYLRENTDLEDLIDFYREFYSFRFEGTKDWGATEAEHYASIRYNKYKQITIGE